MDLSVHKTGPDLLMSKSGRALGKDALKKDGVLGASLVRCPILGPTCFWYVLYTDAPQKGAIFK